MKQVYATDDRLQAMNYKNIIENAGIQVTLKNEYSAGGSIPVQNLWLELWVDNTQIEQAQAAIQSVDNTSDADDWTCPSCSEHNGAAFQICWKCQTPVA